LVLNHAAERTATAATRCGVGWRQCFDRFLS
jgi:hypothetical protein